VLFSDTLKFGVYRETNEEEKNEVRVVKLFKEENKQR